MIQRPKAKARVPKDSLELTVGLHFYPLCWQSLAQRLIVELRISQQIRLLLRRCGKKEGLLPRAHCSRQCQKSERPTNSVRQRAPCLPNTQVKTTKQIPFLVERRLQDVISDVRKIP